MEFILLLLVGMGAAFVQRVSGFGLGIFAMSFLPHILPTHTAAAAISSLFSCVTTTYNSIRYRRSIAFKTAVPMIGAALVTITVAVRFAAMVPGDVFKLLLGGVLILMSLYFIFFNQKVKIRATVTNGLIAGSLGGVLGGLFSTGGPPAVLYMSNAVEDNLVYFATVQFYFCFTNLYATFNRAISGILTWQVLLYAAVGVVGCLVGDLIGGKVFDKLDGKALKKVIYIGMIISGVLMFF